MKHLEVIAFGLQDGSGFWRIRIPFGELNKHGHHCILSPNEINEEEMKGKDVIVIKNVTDKVGLGLALEMKEKQGSKIFMDLDDDITVRKDNPMYKEHKVEESNLIFSTLARYVDGITVTTEYLANKIRGITDKPVIVAPNSFDPSYHIVENKKQSGPIRIGWGGSMTHEADLKMIAPVVKRIKETYPVKFVTIGDARIKKWWGNDVEVCPPVKVDFYMQALASMGIDIGICPLVDDEFNRCKSPIKSLEFGLLGVPVVASPTVYKDIPTVDIANNEDQWFEMLSNLIKYPEVRKRKAEVHRNWVLYNTTIEKTYKIWEDLYLNG